LKTTNENMAELEKNRHFMKVNSKGNGRGFGGLEVACWPLEPKFVDSNLAKTVRFFRAKKSSARLPSEGK
jgi:hypothetical protein